MVDIQPHEVSQSFAVNTIECDRTTAWLRTTGMLDHSAAELLEEVVAGHLRAGRLDLHLDIRGLISDSPAALSTLYRLTRRALAARGTLVLSAF